MYCIYYLDNILGAQKQSEKITTLEENVIIETLKMQQEERKHQMNKQKTMAKAQEEEKFISGLDRKRKLGEKVAKNVESDLENFETIATLLSLRC